ncbi:hypothetical protein ACHAWO_001062, partial [Cyclotella atomus]
EALSGKLPNNLAAHAFLDYNRNATEPTKYGPDGCIDFSNSAHAGLEDIWCDECALTKVYEANFKHISKADFWIASGKYKAAILAADGLDLKDSFVWGRVDQEDCPGSAERMPEATSCSQVKTVFLDRLGLSYIDAVALIGAHTLGRGDTQFSGEVTTGFGLTRWKNRWCLTKSSLKRSTDALGCLVFDIDTSQGGTFPCCSRTDTLNNNEENPC